MAAVIMLLREGVTPEEFVFEIKFLSANNVCVLNS